MPRTTISLFRNVEFNIHSETKSESNDDRDIYVSKQTNKKLLE